MMTQIPLDFRTELPHTESHRSELHRALDAFLEAKRIKNLSPRSIETYCEALEPLVEWLILREITKLAEITPHVARLFIRSLQERGLAQSTVASRSRVAKVWLNWLAKNGWRDGPVDFEVPLEDQTVGRTLTEDEVRRMIQAAPTKRDRAIVAVLAATGVRLGELLNMRWEDLHETSIRLPKTKARKPRVVGLDQQTLTYLMDYRVLANSHPQRHMWQRLHNNDDLQEPGIRAAVRKVAKLAGVPDITVHAFRRFFATSSLSHGMPLEVARRLMGHADFKMILRYAALSDQHLLSDYARYGPFSEREDSDE